MATSPPKDNLVEEGSPSGVVILNRGDPAFSRIREVKQLDDEAQELFIHLIAYLLFAEAVVVPSRFLIDGAAMAQVAFWAAPLLREGLIVPERRGGVASFQDASTQRRVDEVGMRRSEFLDQNAAQTRSFHFDQLSDKYIQILHHDLGQNGAFRRTVRGGRRGRLVEALDVAERHYANDGDFTPESFMQAVRRAEPRLSEAAMRWAMARYYTTPLLFDRSNTRELPEAAAQLLVSGGVMDSGLPYFDSAAPVTEAHARISRIITRVPGRDVALHSAQYCEALLEVRRSTPQARKLFSGIRDRAAISNATGQVAAEFDAELKRQMKVKSSASKVFTLATSVVGGGVGYGAGIFAGADIASQIGIGLAASVATGFATTAVEGRVSQIKRERMAPWLVAMDRLESRASN